MITQILGTTRLFVTHNWKGILFSSKRYLTQDFQGLDFDANQRIDSRRDSRHTIGARIKVDSRERYHD